MTLRFNSFSSRRIIGLSAFAHLFRPLLVAAITAGSASVAFAGYVNISANTLGYSMEWTRFDSLSDAQAQVNPTAYGSIGNRDAEIIIRRGKPSESDVFAVATGWDLAPGSPSNTSEGFLQIVDDRAATLGPMVAGYTDNTGTEYLVQASGTDAWNSYLDPVTGDTVLAQQVRLGVGDFSGSNPTTAGGMLEYSFNFTFTGLNGVVDDTVKTSDGVAPLSISGNAEILFWNFNPNASNEGYYWVEVAFNDDSWAVAEEAPSTAPGNQQFTGPIEPIPEVRFAALLAGLAALLPVFVRRRRS